MDDELLTSLDTILKPNQMSLSAADLQAHARDQSFHPEHAPEVVVWPESTADVSAVLRWANKHRIPITAWGGGTSLEGNPIPVRGGIVLDMTRMSRRLEVLPDDFQVRVQPGILGDALNAHLAPYGLFFPAFPGSSNIATIGGMIANNSGGMYTVKYGVVGDNVLELEVVLASGQVMRLGSRSIKTVAGYDLRRLVIGSEGTLGIVTEATLRLRGIPQGRLALMAAFDTPEQATGVIPHILRAGFQVAAIELMDTAYIGLINLAKSMGWREKPSLLIELHGLPESIAQEANQIETLCREGGGEIVERAITDEARTRLWEGRRAVRPAVRSILPEMGVLAGDIGIPPSRIAELIRKTRDLGAQYGLRTAAYGHAGDGNFHIWALYKLDDPEAWERAVAVNDRIVRFAIEAGGTSTAEHGIGIGKRRFLPLEHASSIEQMAAVKRLFDPNGILNPGKIFPDGG